MTPARSAPADAPAAPIAPLHLAPRPEDRLPGYVYPGDYGFPAELRDQVISVWRELGDYDAEHQAAEDRKAQTAIIETLLSLFPDFGRHS
jgi:hypothetical protein